MLKTLLILSTVLEFLGANWDGWETRLGVKAEDGALIQLMNGDDKCSGRVEILHKNKWATVCDHGHGWGFREADVVCLELGCGLALRTATFGPGTGEIWRKHVQCAGHEQSLTHCSSSLPTSACTHDNDAGVICSGELVAPTLSLVPHSHTIYSAGEAVRFRCSVLVARRLSDFHLFKRGVATPLVTQRVDSSQVQAELTLSDLETFHQGSYSCVYRIKGSSPSQLLPSPPSNYVNITVVELLTPYHWYNTSIEAPLGSVIKGHSFNITCSTQQLYPGASFQLRLIRSNGTVRQTLPALSPSVTFSFPSAQSSHEGYYYCLYRVQMGGRTFLSRESQPLPLSVRDPDPLLSPMVISWLVSGLTFFVALVIIVIVARVLCKREKKPSELERETRTCVDNTYVALAIK